SGVNRAQQSLAVIDLNARPAPVVIQNVYFPAPQSLNIGLAFAPQPDDRGNYAFYASGGVENKVWVFQFHPGDRSPVSPGSPGPNTRVEAPSIDLSSLAAAPPSERINSNQPMLYAAGLALSPDAGTLFVANNEGDNLAIIGNLNGANLNGGAA